MYLFTGALMTNDAQDVIASGTALTHHNLAQLGEGHKSPPPAADEIASGARWAGDFSGRYRWYCAGRRIKGGR